MLRHKVKYIVLIVFFLIIISKNAFALRIQRICVKGNDVVVMYYNISDTCNKFLSLIIYARENPFDVFKPVDTIYNPSVTDYIHLNVVPTSTKWNYFLKMYRNCPGKDSVYSDTMAIDLIRPNNGKINIDSISVKNGKTIIGWKASISPDTKGYVIYYRDFTGINVIIDTVYGKNNTFYQDNGIRDPDKRVENYMIAALDSCDNITLISPMHNTIYHTGLQDTCRENIALKWNKYYQWEKNNTEYSIFYSKNGGLFNLFQKITNSDSSFTISGLDNFTQYCFYISAHNLDSGFTSSSNITCYTTNFIVKPTFVYLKNVTVNGSDLEISWAIDKVCQIKEFYLYKKVSNQSFTLYQTIPYDNNTDFSFTDDSVNVNTNKYRYYIEEEDICDNPTVKSNEGGNILLKNYSAGNTFQLKWNKYTDWSGAVKNQTIFRKKETEATFNFLDNPPLADESYVKNLSVNELKGEEFCYYLENYEGDTNKYGYKETSTSNITCISGAPKVFVPNAFCPKGEHNPYFKPVGKNIDSNRTEIQIFNRWGQFVWQSTGISEGWNGKNSRNESCPTGVYCYFIIIYGKDGSKIELTGNVTLID